MAESFIIARQPSVRSQIDWTPSQIRAAQAAADAGSLAQAAAVCEWVLADDRVAGVLGQRTHGLLGLPLSLEDGAGAKRRKASHKLESTDDFWDMLPEEQLASLLGWRILLGVGFGQLEWTDHGDRIVPRLTEWHPSHVKWDWEKRQWLTKVDKGADAIVTPGDGQWVVYAAAGLRPWARGAWRAVAAWCLLKQYAKSDWARYSERHGMGTFVATATDSSVEPHREKLASELETLGRDAAIVFPHGFDLKLVEATANTWTTYQAQIAVADAGIAIAISGQNLTSEVQGGSLAAAQVHARVALQFIKGDAESLSTCLHDQVFEKWAELNFGDNDAAPWPKWDTSPPEDKAAKAQVLVNVGTAIQALKYAGVPVDEAALAEQFDIPLRQRRAAPSEPLPTPSSDPASDDQLTPGDVPQASGNRVPSVRLASGFYAESSGFIDGQEYADRLADKARDRAAEALAPWVEQVRQLVRNAGSVEQLRRELILLAESADKPGDLDAIAENTIVMGSLAGRAAVLEDL